MSNFYDNCGSDFTWSNISQLKGFSNFQYVDEHFGGSPILRRIFSLARKHGYLGLGTDRVFECNSQRFKEEAEDLKARDSDYLSSEVYRIFFFSEEEPSPSNTLVGYAVYKKDFFRGSDGVTQLTKSHVYEAIIPPVRGREHNNFIPDQLTYTIQCEIGGLELKGCLFAQQNTKTYACSQVSLRMMLSQILPEQDISYRRINKLAGVILEEGESIALNEKQIESVFSGLDLAYKSYHISANQGDGESVLSAEYQNILYGLIESGSIALLGFAQLDMELNTVGSRHMLPILGHTFNEDSWTPGARKVYFHRHRGFFSSELWLSNYVVHDDNFGPYYCIPRHFLSKSAVKYILGVQKKEIVSEAHVVEKFSHDLLENKLIPTLVAISESGSPSLWQKRFLFFANKSLLILRTVALSRGEYLKHLRDSKGWAGSKIEEKKLKEIEDGLPNQFWMIELSIPELFTSSRRKLGELIIAGDQKIQNDNLDRLVLAIRIPMLMLLFKTISPGVKPLDLPITSHSKLYTNN